MRTSKTLAAFPRKVESSWVASELRGVRNFHQGFQHGLWIGLAHAAVQFVTGGRGLIDPMRGQPVTRTIIGSTAPGRRRRDLPATAS